jgi:hypothetical protein
LRREVEALAEQPAPVQDTVAFKQFLSDVHTAAGLVTHGKQCKALGERLGEGVMRYMTTPPAAPVQERCKYCDGTGDVHDQTGEWRGTCHCVKAAQRQWVGLTDAEVMHTMSGDWTSQFYFARAIEAKLKEKNT